jgi:shikimate kinase
MVVLRTTHRELLPQLGTVVYLHADEETLFERISRRASRPLLRTDDPRATMKQLLEGRLPLYEEIADVRADTSQLDHDEVCDLILQNFPALKRD